MSTIRTLSALFLILVMASPVFAASHREAPLISADPTADNTDFYMFRSWQDPSKVVLIMNVIPGQEPGAGPNYFNFADDVLYEIHLDTNKNNIAQNITYQIRFRTEIRPPGNVFPLSYVAIPPITSLDGGGAAGLILRQTYTVTEVHFGGAQQQIGQGIAVPSNVGPRTMPNYESLASQGIFPLSNGGRVFAGQRDETFYIDLGAIFDTLNLHAGPILSPADDANDAILVGAARDTLSGFNINTIALEIPISVVTGPNGNQVIGGYTSTSRPKVSVLRRDSTRLNSSRFAQVSRMGNPLVNELIIPTDRKDRWNAGEPENEAQFLAAYCTPAIVAAINQVFGTNFPTANREDLVNALLRYPPGPGPAVCGGGPPPDQLTELLRVDLTVPPTAPANQKRLGPLAHDASGSPTPDPAGWPNGRRPNDDVTDLFLRVGAGALINPGTPNLGDGVNFNIGAPGSNKTANGISTVFPFLPTPHDGRDRRHIDPGEPLP